MEKKRSSDAPPSQVHFSGVNLENVETRVLIRRGELNFPEVIGIEEEFH